MDFNSLMIFKTIAYLENISKASQKLNIAQPSLSRSIKILEQEVGFHLFEHKKNRIVLNKNGSIFLDAVNKIMLIFDNAIAEIQENNLQYLQTVTIQINSAGMYLLELMPSFKAMYPNTKFILGSDNIDDTLDDEIDLFLCSSVNKILKYSSNMLICEELYLTVSDNNPLSKLACVALSTLANENFIFSDKKNDMYEIQMHYCQKAGFYPQILTETEKQHILLSLISLNEGICLLPRLSKNMLSEEHIRQIPINDLNCHRYVHIIVNPHRYQTNISKKFQKFCVDYFKKIN